MGAASIPFARSSQAYARLFYSFGPGNGHGPKKPPVQHPVAAAITAHTLASWSHGTWTAASAGTPLLARTSSLPPSMRQTIWRAARLAGPGNHRSSTFRPARTRCPSPNSSAAFDVRPRHHRRRPNLAIQRLSCERQLLLKSAIRVAQTSHLQNRGIFRAPIPRRRSKCATQKGHELTGCSERAIPELDSVGPKIAIDQTSPAAR